MRERAAAFAGVRAATLVQALVTEYEAGPGSGGIGTNQSTVINDGLGPEVATVAPVLEKTLLTVGLLLAIVLAAAVVRALAGAALRGESGDRPRFWIAQILRVAALLTAVVVVARIWANDATQLASAAGWLAAGLTIALQRVVTAFSGYVIILRSRIFTVGDRITIGSVRGDVVALGFMQTTVMEMGQGPAEQDDAPSMWVKGRQYTGRLVRITNDKVFDAPVYNYTRDFPFVWEELTLPIRYQDDYGVVERILLDVASRHTREIADAARPALQRMREKYFLNEIPAIEPQVYVRMTDNWVELSLRFLSRDRGVRALHDAMTRELLAEMRRVRIGVASGTYAIVELPSVRVELAANANEQH
ncbi:MAG TPA: mechanosensitive ion channel domain-containing protein [Gemmatimonadaceae bacterium]|nr:mechanosensitive ion channel domain-containing protein [Gemmatimonadaceae bacterium]